MAGLTDTCNSYKEWISDVASEYRRINTSVRTIGETERFFWALGRDIEGKKKLHRNKKGRDFYRQVSKDLKKELSDGSTFAAQNLVYMHQFYRLFPNTEEQHDSQHPHDEIFLIPWEQTVQILNKNCTNLEKILFFEQKVREYKRSTQALIRALGAESPKGDKTSLYHTPDPARVIRLLEQEQRLFCICLALIIPCMPTFFITGIPYCIFGYYSSDQALKFAMSNPKLSSEMERRELSKMLQSLRLRYILQLITLMFLFIGVTTCICHPDECDGLFAVLAMTAALQAAFLFTAQNESRRILKVLRGGRNSGTFNKRLRFREFGSRSSVRNTDISFAEYILFALVGLLTFAVNIIVFSGGIVLESMLNHP